MTALLLTVLGERVRIELFASLVQPGRRNRKQSILIRPRTTG